MGEVLVAGSEVDTQFKPCSLSLCPLWGTHPTWWGKSSPFRLVPSWQPLACHPSLKFRTNVDASSHPWGQVDIT